MRSGDGETGTALDPKDLSVLLHLIEAAPGVVATEALLERSWPGAVVGDNALQQVIARLRRAFGDDARAPRFIETLPRRGYRLMVTPEFEAGEKPSKRSRQARSFGWTAALFGIVALGLLVWTLAPDDEAAPRDNVRIVLLPFDDLNPREDFQQADEISRAVRARVASLDGVDMIAARSAEIAKASHMDIPEIARQLDVDYVIEGAVNRRGRQVQVNAHLLKGADGVELGSAEVRKVVAETSDYFALYDEIAGRISGAFDFEFASRVTVDEGYVPRLEAYERVQRAWNESLPRVATMQLLDEAIVLDPGYARAYAVRSFYQAGLAEERLVRPVEGFRAARVDAERALRLDPREPLALAMRGAFYDRLDLDFGRALAAYREAIRHGANAEELAWMQDTLINAGLYEEGLALTLDMERLSPLAGEPIVFSGRFLWRMGREVEAIAKFERALTLGANRPMVTSNAFIFFMYYVRDYERVRRLIGEVQASADTLEFWKASLDLEEGDPAPMRALLQSWQRDRAGYVDSLRLSNAYFLLGDYAEHFAWFRRRVEDRANVGWVMDLMRTIPDYWQTLQAWAEEDPAVRGDLLRAHRRFFDEHTKDLRIVDVGHGT